ncbi:hypothetical protein [Niabella soli]|uniref:Uncharacterized protein n=1 Tax=Niabella soli DSM 19437 TaxID=929713 RepID=W0F334_9BACT|nr:hypothetical protein [Niabella soli]AHF17442.1 hypothetical protein NIASO_07580 [Niabella soli DSM 19437]
MNVKYQVNSRSIILMVITAVMLIAFIYGLLYELYVIKNWFVVLLFCLLIVGDIILFVKLFWSITANRRDDY